MKTTYGLWLLLFLGMLLATEVVAGNLQAVESKANPPTALEIKLTEQVKELEFKNLELIKSEESQDFQTKLFFIAALIGIFSIWLKYILDLKKAKKEKQREEFTEIYTLMTTIYDHLASKTTDLTYYSDLSNLPSLSVIMDMPKFFLLQARFEVLTTILLPSLQPLNGKLAEIYSVSQKQFDDLARNLLNESVKKDIAQKLLNFLSSEFMEIQNTLREAKHNYI